MKKTLEFILKILAKAVLNKYRPKIIGITGSVGKTSTKEAIFAVLKNNFRTRRNVKNYNNEIGLPLTILGCKSANNNIFGWLQIFLRGLFLLILPDKKYPQILVLEMAVDRINDMDYLLSIVRPDISVITIIGSSHLEHFGTLENILREKSKILRPLPASGWAIINGDDPILAELVKQDNYQVMTYGQNGQVDIQVTSVDYRWQAETYGTGWQLKINRQSHDIFLPNVLGSQHALALAAATAVGLSLGMKTPEIIGQFSNYQAVLGRTNLLKGIKNTWIIDDTYNSSPQSAKVALEILARLPVTGRKLAVLGDMLELGKITETEHRQLGEQVFKAGVDYLYAVGERARDIARGALNAGMHEDKIFHFPFNKEAGLFLQERLNSGDCVLIKGSRGMKMEQIVYEIMAKPWEANEVLVARVK